MCNESRPVRDGEAEFTFVYGKSRRDGTDVIRRRKDRPWYSLLTLRGFSSRPSSHHLQPSKSTFRKVFERPLLNVGFGVAHPHPHTLAGTLLGLASWLSEFLIGWMAPRNLPLVCQWIVTPVFPREILEGVAQLCGCIGE